MEQRTRALLYTLIGAMRSTRTAELQYLIQRTAPVVLRELDRAHSLRESL